ncbi:MAG TPA: MFS transporter [Streptosporangiaceae bacterium]|jgi:MFS family permease
MSFISPRWPADVYLSTGAKAVSACGDFLAATALSLALQQRGDGGLAVAAVLVAAAVPPVLLVRWAGRLVDRADSRLLLVGTGLVQAGVCVALAFAPGVAAIIALVAVLAAGLAVTGPTLGALLPAMVGRDDLPRVVALGQTASALGIMIAPALGGVLIGHFGLRVPLLADAASYLAIAVAGRLIRTRRGGRARAPVPPAASPQATPSPQAAPSSPATPSPGAPVSSQAPAPARVPAPAPPPAQVPAPADGGWRLREDALLRSAFVLVGAVLGVGSLVNVAEVFFIRQDLHSTATAYGLVAATWIGSTIIGGQLLGRRRPSDAGLALALVGALALDCVAVAIMAAAPDVGWLIPINIVGGLGNGGLNVATSVLLGRRVPAAARGRAGAAYGAVVNAAAVSGYLLGGLLLAAVPVRACIAAAGVSGLSLTAAFAVPLLRAAGVSRGGRTARA